MNKDIEDIKKKLNFAFSYIQNNNHSEAIKIYESILQENDKNFEANSNLGMLYAQFNNLETSEKYLNKAIEIDPKNPYALNNLASILIKLGRNDESIKYSQKAINIKQNFSLAYNNLGLAKQNISKNEDAKISFLKAIETENKNVLPYYNLAFLYESLDEIKNSEIYYLKAIEINPRFFNAYNNLMNLYERINDDDKLKSIIEKGEKIFSNNFSIKLFKGKLQFKSKLYNEAILNLESFKFYKNNYLKESLRYSTLASCYDEIKNFDKAFEYFELANLINFEIHKNKLDKNKSTKLIDDRIDFFNEKNIKNWKNPDVTNGSNNPVFIIGFPRSGTTLLNTILNSHPEINVIEEKPIVNKFINLLNKETYSNFSNLENLDKNLLQKLRIAYFDILKNYIKQGEKKVQIDKMPLNIIHVGEIVRIFPEAKFIFALRHPCDCILSCFMQNFSLNDSMANFTDLKSTSKFYNKIMTLWQQYLRVFKINYYLVRYEDIVNNFEISVKKLLHYLDLDWSDSINNFYDKKSIQRKISTPSYNQVNKPIYLKSVGRWENYSKQFEEIYSTVEPWIRNFKY